MIHRCFVSRNVELLTRAFVTYVRPLLEYSSVIWSPSLKRDSALLGQVHRRFTKRLPGLKDHSYDERLKLLNLERLELCRIWSDLLWCYKIAFGLVHVNREELLQAVDCQVRNWHVNCQHSSWRFFGSCISSEPRAAHFTPEINRTQAAERAEKMPLLSLVTLTFDIWPWPSNSSERGTKHIFRVNLPQIRSAIFEIFHIQTKKHRLTAPKQNVLQFTACGKNAGSHINRIRKFLYQKLFRRMCTNHHMCIRWKVWSYLLTDVVFPIFYEEFSGQCRSTDEKH